MPRLLTFDFETYYDVGYGFKSHTTEEYIRDPKFQVIGVSVKVDDAPAQWFTGTHQEIGEWLRQFPWESCIAVAHNAKFDAAVLNWVFGIIPRKIWCTMAIAMGYVGLKTSVSLAGLGEFFKCRRQKGHEVVSALGLRREDFPIVQLALYGAYCVNDTEMTYELLIEHLLPNVLNEELELIDWTIRAFSEPELELDAALIDLEYRSYMARRAGLLAAAGVTDVAVLRSDNTMAALLMQMGVVPPQKVSPATGELVWAFAKSDIAFMDLREHEDERVVALVEARLGSKTSQVQTRLERFAGIAKRGLLPVPLEYCGATPTRRWSGTDKINLQNLPRSTKTQVSPLRQAIRARKGRKIVVGDLSQIELRVNAWQSGQRDVLDLLRSGGDSYADMGTSIFGFEVMPGIHKVERFVGKTAVLGCGYQCGPEKFQHMIKVAARRDGYTLQDESLDFAQSVVSAYRTKNRQIVSNWYAWNNALEIIAYGGVTEIGPYRVSDQKVWLPNGSYLYYPQLEYREKQGKDEQGCEWQYVRRRYRAMMRTKIYGGKLVENITQAVARLFVSDALLRLRTVKYQDGRPVFKIVGSVHDELICTFEEGLDEAWVLDVMKWAFTTAPAWAPDLPLAYEGGIGYNYAECK